VNFGNGGMSLALPNGAPASTQRVMVEISPSVSRASLANDPTAGSANQGGICRALTLVLIDRIQGRASS
jgi:hypothetical protein